MLKCIRCGEPHDLELHPDEGLCLHCNGALYQEGDVVSERSLEEELGEIMGNAELKMRIARGTVDKSGAN